MYKLGILGLVHDHIWIFYQDDVKEIENCEIVAAADPNEKLLARTTEVYGVDKDSLYTDYDEMLENEDLDAVLIFAPSNQHGMLTEKAAKKGLHVMVEKPMAASLAEADLMIKTCEENNVRLMINYPIANKPMAPGIIKMIRDGELGHVYSFRFRMGHKGPENCDELTDEFREWLFDPEQNGGGAMADFCTYGAAVLTAALGPGSEVSAMTGNLIKKDQKAEDNGIITVKYNEEGKECIAVLEGTWSQMVFGANDSIFGDEAIIVSSPEDGEKYKMRRGWDWSDIDFPKKDEVEDKAIKYFVHRLRNDLPFEGIVDPVNARAAQEIIEAAYQSVETGKKIQLPLSV